MKYDKKQKEMESDIFAAFFFANAEWPKIQENLIILNWNWNWVNGL